MSTPIVFVHGILGFDRLRVAGVEVADYFRDIPALLRADGHVVPTPPALNRAGTIAHRAGDLKRYLETHAETAGKRVHLVAHSMGGLDSRFMISRLGMADRIVSLTTIATPHRGSPIADMVVSASLPGSDEFLAQLGIDVRGIPNLTTAACARFNEETPESDSVRYFSIAGQFDPPRLLGLPLGVLSTTHDLIRIKEGANDGMVSVQSALFGQTQDRWTHLETWRANHFREVNWGENLLPSPLERADAGIAEKYRALARRLAALQGAA
jgi:triacylglycerol lipase